MKRVLILLLLVALVLFGAGCAGKGEDKAPASSNDLQNPEEKAAATPAVTSADAGSAPEAQPAETGPEDVSASDTPKEKDAKKTVKETYPQAEFVDPNLEKLYVQTNDASKVIVNRLEFVDNRDSAESTKWGMNIQFKNIGEEPAYLDAGWTAYNLKQSKDFLVLSPGETVWLKIDCSGRIHFNPEFIVPLYVTSHEKVTPEIDPVFSNLDSNISMSYYQETYGRTFLDLHSIKCVVDDEERGWKSIAMEASAHRVGEERKLTGGAIEFLGKDGHPLPIYGMRFSMPPGEKQTVKVPLESVSPEDIYSIRINAGGS